MIFSFIIPYSVHFRQYLILTKKSLILTNQNALPSSNISSCHKIVRTPCYTNRKSKTRPANKSQPLKLKKQKKFSERKKDTTKRLPEQPKKFLAGRQP